MSEFKQAPETDEQTPEVTSASPDPTADSPSVSEETKEPEGKKPGLLKTILDYAVSIAIAVAAALLINNFILINATIPSGSMESTIMTGDRIFGFRLSYLFSDPERGDIVIFKAPDKPEKNYIKRVIGLPGDTVLIKAGKVYINGSETPLDEPYLNETPYEKDFGPYEVPEGCYFMMGDNRNHSNDSRYWTNTFVTRDAILAKAIFRYWGGFKIFHSAEYD